MEGDSAEESSDIDKRILNEADTEVSVAPCAESDL